ncbi:MAG: BamA/TamA family outer membrane protein [Deltaproteobacteria bacterium]|nr:BamA/TamA family outer membrane protein [Deltaproteobacteria bacterium]
MVADLDGCREKTDKVQGSRSFDPHRLLLVMLAVFFLFFLVLPCRGETYKEQDYHDSFSTDFFLPYLDYNEKDGIIPGVEWQGSNYTGDHVLSFRGGVGTESGKEQLLAGYTYLGWYPAVGLNLFDKNTYYGDLKDTGYDEDDWRREAGGSLTFSFPLDLYHRIVTGYEISWVDLPDEWERLNGLVLSLVRDTADYYLMEIISGSQVDLTAKYGNEYMGSETTFQSYAGDVRLYTNLALEKLFGAGQRLVPSLRVHGGVKKDDPRLFVLGGENSLRGYDFNEFSGEKLWAASLELRYPFVVIDRTTTAWDLFYFHQLLAVAFVDSGQIWREYNDSKSISGAEVGVGGGVRLQMFLFDKIPFEVGFDVGQSVTDRDRNPKVYLVLRLGA